MVNRFVNVLNEQLSLLLWTDDTEPFQFSVCVPQLEPRVESGVLRHLFGSRSVRVKNQLCFVKHFHFQKGTASVGPINFVPDDSGFNDCAQLAKVVSYVVIRPAFRHLADKQSHVDDGSFHKTKLFNQLFLLNCGLGVFKFPSGLFVLLRRVGVHLVCKRHVRILSWVQEIFRQIFCVAARQVADVRTVRRRRIY